MKKRVAVMCVSKKSNEFYSDYLEAIFAKTIDFFHYSLDENGFENMIKADLYLVCSTSSNVFEYSMSCIPENSNVVISSITFKKNSIKKVKQIPKDSNVLMVNLSKNMAMEAISTLNRIGINDINFIPLGPIDNMKDINEYKDIKIAVTCGESRYIPDFVEEVIDLGGRVFTERVLVEMILKLDISEIMGTKPFKSYIQELAERDYGIDELSRKVSNIELKFDLVLDSIDIGVIGIDVNNRIFEFNKAAENILHMKKDDALGKTTDESLPFMPLNVYKDNLLTNDVKLITIKGVLISLRTTSIVENENFKGYFAIIERFKDEEDKQRKLRLQLLNRGHKAKYTFDDIKGNCPILKKVKQIAEKMSKSNASILIYGESGTGKELFAHAIHNASPRSDMPFVAINCAALPENLLESELFGYEEGAFTGAKKGGKAGLFEYAHTGTLFLDEIENMSQSLQVKLLRVLQEKEVIRIGSEKIINIDVKIIAASNENIKDMVEQGKFRKDLYYRINALPINIPPLRDRKDDVLLITDEIKKSIGTSFELSDEVKNIFINYEWEGNIRELRNVIEYLAYVDKPFINIEDLPATFLEEINFNEISYARNYDNTLLMEILPSEKLEKYMYVLKTLYNAKKENISLGRKNISELSKNSECHLSEQEVRTIISYLSKKQLVVVSRGRKGTELTLKGVEMVEKKVQMDNK
ncbi:sigma-54 interaction domain-containing protein [Romboutsia lituseburensis]|uniref:Transcriptional regulator containing PAS, AAA-type ATPase, and DNA-binding Fis domains n=1 Tax=Romboutsia lituseburensis DSM 797 TaxID=1121325 RepID=A0A1G9S0M8_9FIRM|nr:sigma 54-interacting transcriptional regulator [Romboutsia lituseburensis]CEH32885.1 Nif-specific regulatory protein [Romboutsia lituseburensis]SDM28982.1 Transcriptional regulator containing PAS, AAA-type ATPase, and DNA-binding Fis domains [Romboutsia lituseburensis DSM 797]